MDDFNKKIDLLLQTDVISEYTLQIYHNTMIWLREELQKENFEEALKMHILMLLKRCEDLEQKTEDLSFVEQELQLEKTYQRLVHVINELQIHLNIVFTSTEQSYLKMHIIKEL